MSYIATHVMQTNKHYCYLIFTYLHSYATELINSYPVSSLIWRPLPNGSEF